MSYEEAERVANLKPRALNPAENIRLEPSAGFVSTAYVESMSERAITYMDVGYPVHFLGPTGTGKTTLAFHVAARRGRAVTLIHGDDEFGGSDLVGRDAGYRKSRLVDNYIRSVRKTEEEMENLWVDNRLTTACENGDTLIYDEFNRSRPEANNALLSILAEGILNLPRLRLGGGDYLEVHPEFRAIFTSNPEEYAGVHKAQDALLDRLITIELGHFDRETEVGITAAKSSVNREDAETIVDIVRALRAISANSHRPTIRACIAIARILVHRDGRAKLDDPVFRWACRDVLNTGIARVTREGESVAQEKVDEMIERCCASSVRRSRKTAKKGKG